MKLNLKVGDKVYESFIFYGIEGTVIDIEKYLITVEFNGEEYFFPYKDDGDDSNNHFPETLSTTKYTISNFTGVAS